jgi:exonuclease SbcC
MRLLSLNLENFRQHRQTELVFPEGLVGILGANGTGKSTILEAIAWAIYGNERSIVKGGKDTLIWRLAPPQSAAVAELSFVFGDDSFTIKRSQTSTKHSAELRRNNQVIANSTKAVDERIRELLKMNHEEFFNSYFTGQKDLQFLGSVGTGINRERFIGKMLGYERITEAQGDTNKKGTIRYDRNVSKQEESRLKGAIEQINPEQIQTELTKTIEGIARNQQQQIEVSQQLELVQANLTNTQNNINSLETKQKQYQELHTQIAVKKDSYTQAQQKVAELNQEISNLEKQVIHYEQLLEETKNLSDLQTQEQELKQTKDSSLQRNRIIRQLNECNTELAKLQNRLAGINQELAQLPQLCEQIEAKSEQIDNLELNHRQLEQEWQTSKLGCEANINSQRQLLQKLEQQINAIATAGLEGNCPTCERPLHDEFDLVMTKFHEQHQHNQATLNQLQKQLDTLRYPPQQIADIAEEIKEIKQLLNHLQKQQQKLELKQNEIVSIQQQINDKQAQISQLEQEITDFQDDYDQQLHSEILAEITRLTPKYEECLKLSSSADYLQKKQEELAEILINTDKLERTIVALEQAQSNLNFQESEYQQLKKHLDRLRSQLQELTKQQTALSIEGEVLQRDQQNYQAQMAQYRERQAELVKAQYECTLLDTLDKSFTDLREYMNQQIRPQLSEIASSFLNELTDGRYSSLELDKDYNVVVVENGDRKSVISGGEEDIVNLCLRLGISEMIASGRGHQFSLLILDEIFGSLDEQRRENVMQLLNRLNDRFEQVLIITHIGTIKESLNYTITLEYDNNSEYTRVKNTPELV